MFSVIIPLYNKAPYIEKAIRSVTAQTCRDFELIVIDDGSKDGGFETAKKLLDVLTPPLGGWGATCQKNQGVSVTRNNGVKLAKYDYIAFLDADDWWAPTYLEGMKNLIAQYPEAGIYGSSYFKVKNGKYIPANIGVEAGFQQGLINYFQVYAKTLWMPLWTGATVIKKNIFHENNGFKPTLKLGEDFDLWVRAALKYPVAFLNKPLAYYNQDVEQANRAIGTKLHKPQEHMLFALKELYETEKPDSDLKHLMDALRVYGLFPYYLNKSTRKEALEQLARVDWSKQSTAAYRQYYRTPVWLLILKQNIIQLAWKLKQKIK
ncbi:MAG: glycosyltransferase family A protein [Paludibacter sp.]|nr:glycosyltransferase family A protein [Paludibacter sp.]